MTLMHELECFDIYGTSRMRDYVNVAFLRSNWQKVLEKYDVNFVFKTAGSPFSVPLMERKNWHVVHADRVASIFIRNTAANQ